MSNLSRLLFAFIFLFSNQVSAITPETFKLWTDLWIAKNSWQTNLLAYKTRLAQANAESEELSTSDKFIKSFLDLFDHEVVLNKFDSVPTMPTIDRAFLFIDKVIGNLTGPESKIALPEGILCNNIFSAEELSSIILIIFLLEEPKIENKIDQISTVFCQKIGSFLTSDQNYEIACFLSSILGNLSMTNLVKFFEQSPQITMSNGIVFSPINYFIITGKIQICLQSHFISDQTFFNYQ